MTTPRSIVLIVISTLAIMALTYILTLAVCVLRGLHPEGDLMRAFEAAGIYVLGAFTGILVNTRSTHAPEPGSAEVSISATATTNQPPTQ